ESLTTEAQRHREDRRARAGSVSDGEAIERGLRGRRGFTRIRQEELASDPRRSAKSAFYCLSVADAPGSCLLWASVGSNSSFQTSGGDSSRAAAAKSGANVNSRCSRHASNTEYAAGHTSHSTRHPSCRFSALRTMTSFA